MFFLIIIDIKLFAAANDTFLTTDNSNLPNTTYTIKVLLVQFTDVKHDPKYKADDWNNLLFSKWIYATPNMKSPDGESVYGSMRDYYALMSNGQFELTGYIMNPDNNADGEPDWLTSHRAGRKPVHTGATPRPSGPPGSSSGMTRGSLP